MYLVQLILNITNTIIGIFTKRYELELLDRLKFINERRDYFRIILKEVREKVNDLRFKEFNVEDGLTDEMKKFNDYVWEIETFDSELAHNFWTVMNRPSSILILKQELEKNDSARSYTFLSQLIDETRDITDKVIKKCLEYENNPEKIDFRNKKR